MKKYIKIIFIVIAILIGIVILDSLQALVFDNSPILKIREHCECDAKHFMDKGILVDTHYGDDGAKDTVIKGFSYSLSNGSNFEIVDLTKTMDDWAADTALEKIYEDEQYVYFLPCIKSHYIEVRYFNETKENIIEALENGRITIRDLDKFDIGYLKYERSSLE